MYQYGHKIKSPKLGNILICCAYRHTSTEVEHITEYILRTLSNPTVLNKHVVILGDFNFNLQNCDSHTYTMDFVIFYSPQMALVQAVIIRFGKNLVNEAKYVKFLGLLLDENLS